jgi:type IV pilus assembly protein PilY1
MNKTPMNRTLSGLIVVLVFGGGWLPQAHAQSSSTTSCTSTNVVENFTGASTNCTWYFMGGACLTAGSIPYSSTSTPGYLPQCLADPKYATSALNSPQSAGAQVGGDNGNANQDTPAKGGALRFTNDAGNQSGEIVSNFAFALAGSGLNVTFTTETYEGDSGGTNSDGADGISFFLMDDSYVEATNPITGLSYGANNGGPYGVTIGDFGGSLGYTCSVNSGHAPNYNGMIGGYLGLGMDEYGNFLNGDNVNSSGVVTYNGDNTSSGTLNTNDVGTSTVNNQQGNRVGLRGAGATNWAYLSQNPATSKYYPSGLTAAQQTAAVLQACQTGYAWDFSKTYSSPTNVGVSNPYNAMPLPSVPLTNYAVIPNASKILTHSIANESALYRGYATTATSSTSYGVPITYNLQITTAGLLSLSYSYDGGNYQPIITGQNITTSNGALPAAVRFGFAGSTGGSRNIHEIMCFQAQPVNSAASSAGLNQKEAAKVQTGTQVYFAFYNSNNWTGSLTSQYLVTNGSSLAISSVVNWDGSCVLTGVTSGSTCASTGAAGPLAAENPDTGRVILSYNPTTASGIAFTWPNSGSPLSAGEQSSLDDYDPSPPSSNTWPYASNLRLEYLRGQRGDEQNAYGVDPLSTASPAINPSGFRARTSVLGDIVDSSPTWVGPPSASFPALWSDYLYASTAMPENSGPAYATFKTTYESRMNVVYAGANDGFLHGFRSGFFDTNGAYDGSTSSSGTFTGTDNDGLEVLAYMPAYVVNNINTGSTLNTSTGTYAQNGALDYTNPLYAHKFSVDATPGTGDLFYGTPTPQWHTWLVAGLGAGGSAIYALDITNPGVMNAGGGSTAVASAFTQANAPSLVIGEWSSSLTRTTSKSGSTYSSSVSGYTTTLTCANVSSCGASLGNTYGTPQIRRFHNTPANTAGNATSWGAVFGNGGGSYNGDAGIFVMLVTNSGATEFYYLSTGVGSRTGTANGIYYVSPADLDGDHITDYVYAGDLLGNVWRFDLTSNNPSKWSVTQINGVATPIYTTPNNAPITTKLAVVSIASTPNPRVLIEFGTGEQTPFTNASATTYLASQQYLIGVWDWNLSAWNSMSNVVYDALTSTTTPTAPTAGSGVAPISGTSQLEQQSIQNSYDLSGVVSTSSTSTTQAAYFRTVTNNCINWPDYTQGCSSTGAGQYGWYLQLNQGYSNANDPAFLTSSSSIGSQLVYEQVIFNPAILDGAFVVNTTIPPTANLATCSSSVSAGWTMAINPATGGAFTNSFFGNSKGQFQTVDGQIVSGLATNGSGTASAVQYGSNYYLAMQTTSGVGTLVQVNPQSSLIGGRLTWIEKR